MAAANSVGWREGKRIDMQSIVMPARRRWYGHEGKILRFVFVHSLRWRCLLGW